MIEVKVSALAIDQVTKTPIVFLKEVDGDMFLPIWIGPYEADAIARGLEKEKLPRPFTHDLIKNILNGFNINMLKIVVNKIENETYYATLVLEKNGELFEVDARPSDSIAIALRMNIPLYVEDDVMKKNGTSIELDSEIKKKALKEHLKNLDLENFGKYKL
ncbi:MAG: bifunctional nuclease family protein [Candidatus Cloacimonadota bacterium]|nr:MAG: bifunctional nuclease family protein [Candidatus Cloacimonadota bacterium]